MHQSIVTTAPPGPGNSGDFNFWSSKPPVKSPPCGDIWLVKSLPNSPAPHYMAVFPAIFGAKTKPPQSLGTAGT